MNNILIVKQIINANLDETQNRKDLNNNLKDIYKRISFDLNLSGISNKILNIMDIYGFYDYYFILIFDNNEYLLIDLNLENKCEKINDNTFNEYLKNIGIDNNKLLLKEIYEKRSLGR